MEHVFTLRPLLPVLFWTKWKFVVCRYICWYNVIVSIAHYSPNFATFIDGWSYGVMIFCWKILKRYIFCKLDKLSIICHPFKCLNLTTCKHFDHKIDKSIDKSSPDIDWPNSRSSACPITNKCYNLVLQFFFTLKMYRFDRLPFHFNVFWNILESFGAFWSTYRVVEFFVLWSEVFILIRVCIKRLSTKVQTVIFAAFCNSISNTIITATPHVSSCDT